MGFGAAPVCSETFTMAEDPKAFCCWGKKNPANMQWQERQHVHESHLLQKPWTHETGFYNLSFLLENLKYVFPHESQIHCKSMFLVSTSAMG
jgi:hypothetical protein